MLPSESQLLPLILSATPTQALTTSSLKTLSSSQSMSFFTEVASSTVPCSNSSTILDSPTIVNSWTTSNTRTASHSVSTRRTPTVKSASVSSASLLGSQSTTVAVNTEVTQLAAPQIAFAAATAATAAAGVGAVSSGAASLEAPMLAMIGAVSCGSPSAKKASSSPSPLMYVLSPFAALGLDAMLFGNMGLAAAFGAGSWAAARGLAAYRGVELGDAALVFRFPSWAIKMALLALNGITFAGFSLLQAGQAEGSVGVVYMAALVLLAEAVRRRMASEIYFAEVPRQGLVMQIALPRGIWMPDDLRKRFGVLFSSIAPSCQHLALHPVVYGVCFALVSSFDASVEYCYIQYMVLALMALGLAAFVAWLRPYRGPVTNVLTVASSLSISCTLWCTVAMLRSPTDAASAAAGVFSTVTTVLLLLKTAYSVFLFFIERSSNLTIGNNLFWGDSAVVFADTAEEEDILGSLYLPEVDGPLDLVQGDDQLAGSRDAVLLELAARRCVFEMQNRMLLRYLLAAVNPDPGTSPQDRLTQLVQAACLQT